MALKVKILHCQGVSIMGGNRGQPSFVSIRYIFRRGWHLRGIWAEITEQITFLTSAQSTLAGRVGIDYSVWSKGSCNTERTGQTSLRCWFNQTDCWFNQTDKFSLLNTWWKLWLHSPHTTTQSFPPLQSTLVSDWHLKQASMTWRKKCYYKQRDRDSRETYLNSANGASITLNVPAPHRHCIPLLQCEHSLTPPIPLLTTIHLGCLLSFHVFLSEKQPTYRGIKAVWWTNSDTSGNIEAFLNCTRCPQHQNHPNENTQIHSSSTWHLLDHLTKLPKHLHQYQIPILINCRNQQQFVQATSFSSNASCSLPTLPKVIHPLLAIDIVLT